MSEMSALCIQLVEFLAALLAVLQIARALIHGHRVRVIRIDGYAKPTRQTAGEIDRKTGQIIPDWVFALHFEVFAQNDGLRAAPRVRCEYSIADGQPNSTMTSSRTCQHRESIPASGKSEPFLIDCELQGRLPEPKFLSAHILGLLVPDNGRICRFDAYLFRAESGEVTVSGGGEALGWVKSDLLRIAGKWHRRGPIRLWLWLAAKLGIDRSLLERVSV